MKKLIIMFALVLTFLQGATVSCQPQSQPQSSPTGLQPSQVANETPTTANISIPAAINMTATINGIANSEEATLTISHEGSAPTDELFFKRTVVSEGQKAITVDITANLTDGYYQLLLEAPGKYFR